MEDDLIDGATFDNLAQFADELMQYMIYYNEFRPHQALGGLTPRLSLNPNHTYENQPAINELSNLHSNDGD